MIDFAKEAMDLKQALAENAYPAADGTADIDNHALPIIEVTLRNVAGRRDAEIERLRAALKFYATAQVTSPSPGANNHNCDDGRHARETLADEQTTGEK